jgi:hypothetical protein
VETRKDTDATYHKDSAGSEPKQCKVLMFVECKMYEGLPKNSGNLTIKIFFLP